MAQYAVLIFERTPPEDLPPEIMQAHQRPPARIAEHGGREVAGMALIRNETATSIRGGLVTDGPFIETKEVLAGIFVIEARDLDHALELARMTPPRRRCRTPTCRGCRRGRATASPTGAAHG